MSIAEQLPDTPQADKPTQAYFKAPGSSHHILRRLQRKRPAFGRSLGASFRAVGRACVADPDAAVPGRLARAACRKALLKLGYSAPTVTAHVDAMLELGLLNSFGPWLTVVDWADCNRTDPAYWRRMAEARRENKRRTEREKKRRRRGRAKAELTKSSCEDEYPQSVRFSYGDEANGVDLSAFCRPVPGLIYRGTPPIDEPTACFPCCSPEGESTHKTEVSELRSSLAPKDAPKPGTLRPARHPSEFVRTSAPQKMPPPCTVDELNALADEFDALGRGEAPPVKPQDYRAALGDSLGLAPSAVQIDHPACLFSIPASVAARLALADVTPPEPVPVTMAPARAWAPAICAPAQATPRALLPGGVTVQQVQRLLREHGHRLEAYPPIRADVIAGQALSEHHLGEGFGIMMDAIADARRPKGPVKNPGGFLVNTLKKLNGEAKWTTAKMT